MKQTANGWTVVDEEAGVLVYEYEFAKGSTSNAVTVRMADGSLAVISPARGIEDRALRDLEPFGKVGALVANNGFHYMGLAEWHKTFPEASIYASARAAMRIAKKVPSLPGMKSPTELNERLGKAASAFEVPGLKMGEIWVQSGNTWFVGDSFFNFQKAPGGFVGLLFKWTESGPGFAVNGFSRLLFTDDKPAYKRFALALIDSSGPKAVVPSHGPADASGDIAAQMRALIERRY